MSGRDARARLLVADDEPLFLQTTIALLSREGFECVAAANGAEALAALATQRIDLVISDLNMPGNLQLELLRSSRATQPQVPLIVVTGAASLPTAIEGVRLGIADYLLKPVRYDDLLASVRRALQNRPGRLAAADVEAPVEEPDDVGVIGESPAFRSTLELVDRIAAADANVLITGESGVGKEVIARMIHRKSRRRNAPCQVIDCTAIPESLFESILFGHAKGAFTGAIKDQAGLLCQADDGVAFFDEIGELNAASQAKLLRAIQEQTVTPVGMMEIVKFDARFICATNRNLELEVKAGRFRQDLYYRLAVIHIELPPLRQRGDDVLLLAQCFLQKFSGEQELKFADDALDALQRHTWPGNVRELRNAVERGAALATDGVVRLHDLPTALHATASDDEESATSRGAIVGRADRDYLVSLLEETHGNVARAARIAGLSRQGMHKLLKRHELTPAAFRRAAERRGG